MNKTGEKVKICLNGAWLRWLLLAATAGLVGGGTGAVGGGYNGKARDVETCERITRNETNIENLRAYMERIERKLDLLLIRTRRP